MDKWGGIRDHSFISEAFSDLKVSVGLCPRAYSFIAEAFSNLKVSKGFCPPDYSFIPETFSYLKVLEGLCPSAYSFISEAFSDLKVSAGFCLPEHSFIPETFLYLKVSEASARQIIPSFKKLFQIWWYRQLSIRGQPITPFSIGSEPSTEAPWCTRSAWPETILQHCCRRRPWGPRRRRHPGIPLPISEPPLLFQFRQARPRKQ